MMLDRPDIPHWPTLLRPLADASMALGRLSHALEASLLHQAWLWRETARAATRLSQIAGHRMRVDRLMLNLAGVPFDRADDEVGLAAARRVFLTAAPLFRSDQQADLKDSRQELFEPLWRADGPDVSSGDENEAETEGEGTKPTAQLLALVRELAAFSGIETRPKLLDLFLDLRQHATARRLPPSLVRLALPLSLQQAGLVPKAAPGLLGGRLPLGMTRSSSEEEPVTTWLARGLSELAKEANGARRRLADLTHQHRAWHDLLLRAGLRGHARTPLILDLLAATPVLSASLVARHVGCSPQGAGVMLRQLAGLGIVTKATSRARWKIYLASDLCLSDRELAEANGPLSSSAPLPKIDKEAIETTLDELFSDLERLDRRAKATLAEEASRDQARG